ncbi:MAG TPA: hypothetical protein VFJ16_15980 [Longimicrobium sp.]|nr:hypothetical protein [Longimicrobium sp.]
MEQGLFFGHGQHAVRDGFRFDLAQKLRLFGAIGSVEVHRQRVLRPTDADSVDAGSVQVFAAYSGFDGVESSFHSRLPKAFRRSAMGSKTTLWHGAHQLTEMSVLQRAGYVAEQDP